MATHVRISKKKEDDGFTKAERDWLNASFSNPLSWKHPHFPSTKANFLAGLGAAYGLYWVKGWLASIAMILCLFNLSMRFLMESVMKPETTVAELRQNKRNIVAASWIAGVLAVLGLLLSHRAW